MEKWKTVDFKNLRNFFLFFFPRLQMFKISFFQLFFSEVKLNPNEIEMHFHYEKEKRKRKEEKLKETDLKKSKSSQCR